MRSPAAAIGWELGRRHRWGLAAVGLYIAALAAARLLVFGPGPQARFDDGARFALAVIVPLSSAFMYLLAALSYGFDGDLAARRSAYPARMFTLPVTSAALAGWPMLYGSVTGAVLWLATRLLAVWPAEAYVPVIWPTFAAVVFLAWTQVLAWMPYRARGLRVVALVSWLTLIAVIITTAIDLRAGEALMIAALAPQVPLAFLAARFAVARARRGGAADRRGGAERPRRAFSLRPRGHGSFASPERAQGWLEWRRHGRTLPALVAMVLPFELALVFAFRDIPDLVIETLVLVLLTAPFMAAFVAAAVGKSRPDGSDAYELTPFIAARPLSSAALVAAKLKATARSTLATWLLVLVASTLTVLGSGTAPAVTDVARRVIDTFGVQRAGVIGVVGLAVLVAATWMQLVQGLYIGLSGRAWLVKGSVFVTLVVLTALVALLPWINGNVEVALAVWRMLPWVLAAFVVLKACVAVWTVVRLHDSGLVRDRTLLIGAALWAVVVSACYELIVWLLDLPPSVPRLLPALVAILAVPWVRLCAAPLALAWNRHDAVPRAAPGRSPAPGNARRAIATALLFLVLPATIAFSAAISFQIRNRTNGALVSGGEERRYLLHVPEGYLPGRPVPLVISMHGGASWPAQQMRVSRWNRLADEQGFLVVYPAGHGYPKRWGTFEGDDELERDVDFIAALIDNLRSEYDIDPARIYANGLSNGGGMAFVLSCTLAERIAAVGVVAPAQTLPAEWCASSRPVPVIAFQGDADPIVPYDGGPMRGPFTPVRPVFPAIREWLSLWAGRNGCDPNPAASTAAADVSRLAYSGCADGADVVLFTVHDGGHTWPGGERLPEWFAGPTTYSVDATRQMWAFFVEHPLR